MRRKFIKVTPQKFLDDLLPVNVPAEKTQNKKGKNKSKSKSKKPQTEQQQQPKISELKEMFAQVDLRTEKTLQQSFMDCINDSENPFCPGYKLIDTKDRPARYDETKQRVDACLFHADDIARLDQNESDHPSPNWDLHRLHVEFKLSDADDAFLDKGNSFEAINQKQQDTRGQIISYAALAFKYQHRCFFYTLLVMGPYVRIIRWDRSGAIVTEKFNYQETPELLYDFLKRFSRLTSVEQGLDYTVTVATDEERQMMKEAADSKLDFRDYAREYFQLSLELERKWWKLAIHLDGKSDGSVRHFLVGTPHFYSGGMSGRGTRGYVALDLECLDKPDAKPHEKFVWLKDAWRVKTKSMSKEGTVLRKLNAKRVANVPRLLCHGDVPKQRTRTQAFWTGKKKDSTFNTYVHYRMVVEEVGRPLKDFATGKQLVKIIYNCVMAHWRAYKHAEILHRDVSMGNILIVETRSSDNRWQGYLTDWELSMPVNKLGPRQPHRTGTWQFMSALLLTKLPSEGHCSFQDDLESFFHVMLYMGVRYLKHNVKNVGNFMHNFFDDATYEEGRMMCGIFKSTTMRSGLITYGGKIFQFLPSSSRESKDVEETQAPGRPDFPEDLGDHPDYSAASDDGSAPDPTEVPDSHPLNLILYELLRWFKAYYAKHWPMGPTNTSFAMDNETPYGTDEEQRQIWSMLNEDVEQTTPDEEPQEDTSLAAKLDSHGPYATLLGKCVNGKHRPWPTDDKAGEDQLPPGYDHYYEEYYGTMPRPQKRTLEVGAEPEEAGPSSKRIRSTQASSSKPLPALDISQPPTTRPVRGQRSTRSSTGSKTLVESSSSSKGKSVAR